MVKYVGKVVVPYPRSRVWDLMADWTNLQHWDMNITRSERLPNQPTPDRVGTKFGCTFNLKGRKSEVDYTIIKYNPDTMDVAQFEGFTPRFHSVDTLNFADMPESPNHTEVTASFDLRLRGILAPLSFLMHSAMQSTGVAVMGDINTFIAAKLGEPTTSGSGTPPAQNVAVGGAGTSE